MTRLKLLHPLSLDNVIPCRDEARRFCEGGMARPPSQFRLLHCDKGSAHRTGAIRDHDRSLHIRPASYGHLSSRTDSSQNPLFPLGIVPFPEREDKILSSCRTAFISESAIPSWNRSLLGTRRQNLPSRISAHISACPKPKLTITGVWRNP